MTDRTEHARIATAHERVACQKCHAPAGERCRRMRVTPGGQFYFGEHVIHPHAERLRADGTPLR